MKKQFKDFFDKTNQIHILLSGALLCIIITFVAPVTINFVIKPIVIIMKTEMGAGVDFMMGSHKWHGVAPNDEQLAAALAQLTETLKDY